MRLLDWQLPLSSGEALRGNICKGQHIWVSPEMPSPPMDKAANEGPFELQMRNLA